MSLLSSIARLFGREDIESESQYKNLRSHERHDIDFPKLVSMNYEGTAYVCLNISYGGMLISGQLPEQLICFKIKILDQECSAEGQVVKRNATQYAIIFVHRSSDLLVFLQRPLERMRMGSSMIVLDPSILKEKYRQPGYVVLKGEGPSDLVIRSLEGQLSEFLLTVRNGEGYIEVRYINGKFQTAQTIDREGVGARVALTPEPDSVIIRECLLTMIGLSDAKLRKIIITFFEWASISLKL